MTRKELNSVLIEAVKASNKIDENLPPLKTFVEAKDIYFLNDGGLGADSIYDTKGDFFYSNKALATGVEMDIDYPLLGLIEMDLDIENPFSKKDNTHYYQLVFVVAYPNAPEYTTEKTPHLNPKSVKNLCFQHIHFVFRYMVDHMETNGESLKKLAGANTRLRVQTDPDFNGFSIAWAEIKFPQCVGIDFQKNARTTYCC